MAPHAPYSTSAPLIQSLVAGLPIGGVLDVQVPACAVSSIHLGESPEEVEFLAAGTGPFRSLLADLGAWDDTWVPPGLAPVAYLQQLGALHARLLVVHGTQLGAGELRTLADAGATLVLCPRSNRWVGAGVPPVAAAFAAGVRVAIGTDSLASVEDLNLFAELAFLREIAPDVPASRLLRGGDPWMARRALRLQATGRPGARCDQPCRSSGCRPPASKTWKNGWSPRPLTRRPALARRTRGRGCVTERRFSPC